MRKGLTMVIQNVKHVCNHWHQHILPGTWRTGAVYARALAVLVCPHCMARDNAVETARDILNERGRDAGDP